ncbi:SpaH/EbpB family LPXTG-anchored major pilin [Streptococcus suis]|uniref:SpaH/EbpB family LPXTG-anchored major pilin n=1 Tax=Streptococcus suis TaxID=1307 RepID=UPI001ABE53F4|nr:SpaH/EbpB family LPXTG-anchored major pilin [Streptococcus suis]
MAKHIKKVFGLFLALALLVGPLLGVTKVFAAGNDGAIDVTGATVGKDYSAYKVFDLEYQGSGPDLRVVYTIAPEWKTFFTTAPGSSYIVDRNNAQNTLNPIQVDGQNKFINITEQNVADFAKAAMGALPGKTKVATKTATATTVSFTGLALGYYLVHPEGATDKAGGQGSIVSLTSTTPKGTINAKGVYPTLDKTVDKVSADYGEDLNYTIVSSVPDTTGFTVFDYTITDTLSAGLDLKAGTVKVFIDGADVTQDASVTVNTATPRKIIVDINMLQHQTKVGREVKVTYVASLNENAVIGVNGNPNVVTLEYSRDPQDKTKKDKLQDEEKVYTAAIKVLKHDAGNEAKTLQGAKFVLKNAANQFYKLVNGKVTWVADIAEADVKTTPANGVVEFKGLKNGTYKLHETEAPTGYNKLTEDITVEINYANQTATKFQEVKVANKSGVELPNTGGMGTTIFAIVGASVMLFAAVSLLKGNKKA